MKRVKLVTVVGARPQFIKLAPVSRALLATGSIDEYVVHTGQHYDESMSNIFFEELKLKKPDSNLGVGSGSHAVQTARMLEGLEPIFIKENPDCILIYGDTNSTLSAALVASKLHIPVAHVESGLRSFNMAMPEEVNRIVADHLSEYLFAPTRAAMENLRKEGKDSKQVVLTGDVMYDAALQYGSSAAGVRTVIDQLSLERGKYVLTTLHRAENVDNSDRLEGIWRALGVVSKSLPVVFPVHPRTRERISRLQLESSKTVILIDPVGYLDMVALEANAALIATDSGGVQKEAYFHKVPCVTVRTETEWSELVESGWNVLAPPDDPETLARIILSRLGTSGRGVDLYGSGNASEIIRDKLLSSLA